MLFEAFFSEETQSFIEDNKELDPNEVAFKAHGNKSIPVGLVVSYLKALPKLGSKLPIWSHRLDSMVFPSLQVVEQASSWKAAEYKASIVKGKTLVDLTVGLGADDYAFSQRGFSIAGCDIDEANAAAAQHNLTCLGVNSSISASSAEDFVQTLSQEVDCILVDPDRRVAGGRSVGFSDCSPNVVEMWETLCYMAKFVMVKSSPMIDISAALNDLPGVNEVHVISVNRECKEVLFLRTSQSKELELVVVDINKEKTSILRDDWPASTWERYGGEGKYLYEPSPSIMKAHAWQVMKDMPVSKLGRNAHLFVSESLVPDFPGRVFKVDEVNQSSSKLLKKLSSVGPANLSCRNFDLSVPQLQKKYGFHDGGSRYLFFTKEFDKTPLVYTCSKIEGV